MKLTMKRLLGVILAVAVAGGVLGMVAMANTANNDGPTVTYDAAAETFTFSEETTQTVDGTHWAVDLFNGKFKDMYPGDTATETIQIKVANEASLGQYDHLRIYVDADIFNEETNPNAKPYGETNTYYNKDYKTLLEQGGKNIVFTVKDSNTGNSCSATLTDLAPTGTKVLIADYKRSESKATTTDLEVSLEIKPEAGNEIAGLVAMLDWVFTADVVTETPDTPPGGGGGGGPTPPEIIPDEDVPLAPIPSVLNGDDHFAYVVGYPDGTVKPEGNVTRAETSTMLYRLLKPTWRDIYFTDQNSFSDVEKALWFNKAVSSMANGEYVNGYPDGTFQGNKHITRAEFVTIMVRFLEEDTTYDNPFSDIGSHWAKEYILKAVGAGWIDGYPDGTFRPNNEITRAEAMKIINSVLHRGVNETSELGQPQHLFPDNSDPGKWYYYEVIEATNDHEYEGERPDENWTRNAIDYFYDIVKYERPEA